MFGRDGLVVEFEVELMSWNGIDRGLGFIQTFCSKVNCD